MHIRNDNSCNPTGNPAGKTLAIHQAAVRRTCYSGPVLFIFCLLMASALVAPLSGQTFLPPTSAATGFWNQTPVVHFTSTGNPDWPSEAYLGIRMNNVSWGHAIEATIRGTYDWTVLDSYTSAGGNFLYTFLWVPTWTNAVPTPSSNNVTGFSVTSGVITFTASNSLIASNQVTLTGLSTSCLNAVYTVLGDTHAPTTTTFSANVPGGCTAGASSGGKYSFAGTGYQAPSDLNVTAQCQGVLSTAPPTTDCRYKEFVTAFMQHICPTSSTCKIRNFESWNEFNGNGYWDDKYQNLATMSEDAARIVKAYCTNCQFGAGSVAASAIGWNDSETNSRNSSHPHWTYYDEALTTFLDDWKADVANDSTIPEPEFISWHPYSANYIVDSTHALTPQPMPEYSYSGDGMGGGGNTGSSVCTIANESRTTNKYCIDSVVTQASTISALTSNSAHGVQGKAYWATEGGFNSLASMTNTDNNDTDSHNPKAACTGAYSPVCTADVIRSAYLARWLILLRAGGVGRAYWYSWDTSCFGTLFGMDAAQSGNSVPCSQTYNPGGATLYTLYNTKTRAGNSWDQIQLWLNGASMPTGCAENISTHIYSCTITRTNPAGYSGLMVWYTTWLGTTSYTPPAGYTQYRTLDNPTPTAYSSGSVTLGAEPIIFEKKT